MHRGTERQRLRELTSDVTRGRDQRFIRVELEILQLGKAPDRKWEPTERVSVDIQGLEEGHFGEGVGWQLRDLVVGEGEHD